MFLLRSRAKTPAAETAKANMKNRQARRLRKKTLALRSLWLAGIWREWHERESYESATREAENCLGMHYLRSPIGMTVRVPRGRPSGKDEQVRSRKPYLNGL